MHGFNLDVTGDGSSPTLQGRGFFDVWEFEFDNKVPASTISVLRLIANQPGAGTYLTEICLPHLSQFIIVWRIHRKPFPR
jgi:hypothetical protein